MVCDCVIGRMVYDLIFKVVKYLYCKELKNEEIVKLIGSFVCNVG